MEAVVEKKPYQVKKNAESGKFQVLNSETGALLEGFEDKEFGSPIEGERFMKIVFKSVDEEAGKTKEKNTVSETAAFEIPIIEGKDPVIIVSDREKYFEVTIREHSDDKRTSEPITDGINTTYHVAMGKKVVLPEAVINTAKEAVYTIMHTDKDESTQKITHRKSEAPRFSVEKHREVSPDEARDWLRAQKKTNINIFQ
jgi:hypothetical protein